MTAAAHGSSDPGLRYAPRKRDELHHHDEWARGGLGQGEAFDHLVGQ